MVKRKLSTAEREKARKEFYNIVEQRLDARLERGETYTSTKDLYKGQEKLHDDAFAATQFIAASVAQVLDRAKYRNRLFYAVDAVTHRRERTGPGKSSPYKIYLRGDATPPIGYVLVPRTATKAEVAEYVAMAKGSEDATPHVSHAEHMPIIVAAETPDETTEEVPVAPLAIDHKAISLRLIEVVKEQAELIGELVKAVDLLLVSSASSTNGTESAEKTLEA